MLRLSSELTAPAPMAGSRPAALTAADGSAWTPVLRLDIFLPDPARRLAGLASAAAAPTAPRPLVAQLILNEERFEDTIDVYRLGEAILLPVSELVRAAEGEVLHEDATRLLVRLLPREVILEYRAAEGRLALNGRSFGPELVATLFDQERWFINLEMVRLLFAADIRYDEIRQQVVLKSGFPLPRDLRRARERQWVRLGTKAGQAEAPGRPVQPIPYQALGAPQTDFSLSAGMGGGTKNANWSLNSTQELAYLTSRLYLSGSDRSPLSAARFTAGRTDPQGEILGKWGIYDIQAGDIYAASLPLVGGSARNGLGIVLRATPLEQALTFDRIVIEGEAPPEWDAELYFGGFLVAGQRVAATGRYRFADVPLQYGSNDVKVVLHGPQGQRLTVDHPRHVDGAMVPPGKVYGHGYAFRAGTRALRVPQAGAQTPAEPEWSAGAQAHLGLLDDLTIGAFAQREPGNFAVLSQESGSQPQREYYGFTSTSTLGGVVLNGVIARSGNSGGARQGSAATRLGHAELSAAHEHFSPGYLSAANIDGLGLVRDRYLFTLGFPLKFGDRVGASVTVNADSTHTWSKQQRDRLRLWLSHGLYNDIFLGHEVSATRQSSAGGAGPVAARYGLQASNSWEETHLRGGLNVGLTGADRGRGSLEMSLRGSRYLGYTWTVGANQPLPTGRPSLNASVSRNFGWTTFTAAASVSGSGQIGLSAMLSFSTYFDHAGRARMVAHNVAESANAAPFVFLDRDADGRFDPERDAPIPEARVRIGKRLIEDRQTDADGRMMITGLPPLQPVTIDVDSDSLSDPFLGSLNRGMHFQARPGLIPEVVLPVVELGEVAGSVLRAEGRGAIPLSGVRLHLVDGEGITIAETRTLNDGSFSFDRVPPGSWQVRIAPEQTLRNLIVPALDASITITPTELRRNGLNFFLQIADGRIVGSLADPSAAKPAGAAGKP